MTLTLLDWRRRVAALYAAARAATDPETGWRTWRDGRDELFASHPDSPLDAAARESFSGLPFAPYDPALRFDAVLEPRRAAAAGGAHRRPTAWCPSNGSAPCALAGLGRLDVWWLDSYGGGVFLPLRDGSAGATTYGGGRYLLDTVKGADLGGDGGRLWST